ncbi:MAG: hypothetical protein J6B81_00685 [Spirochaetaceae bacterium]|nr:hypothetical protein [Spirochaetaceae bacterium]
MRGNLGLEDLLKRLSLNLEQIIWVAFSTPVKNPKGNLEQNLLPVPQGKICCKIKMHPLALSTNQEIVFFAEFFTEKQVFHKKIKGAELLELIKVLTATFFKTVTIKVHRIIILLQKFFLC